MIPSSGMFQEIKNYLETNEHENTTIQSLCDITKTGFLFFLLINLFILLYNIILVLPYIDLREVYYDTSLL